MTWQPDDDDIFEQPYAGSFMEKLANEKLTNGSSRAIDGTFMPPINRPLFRTDGKHPVPPDRFADRARLLSYQLRRAARGDPTDALRAIRIVRALTDQLEHEAVAIARGCGWAWQDVAERLGLSRSAVQRRHARAVVPRTRRRRRA